MRTLREEVRIPEEITTRFLIGWLVQSVRCDMRGKSRAFVTGGLARVVCGLKLMAIRAVTMRHYDREIRAIP